MKRLLLFMREERTINITIFLLALVVRIFGIASRPIWYDEAFAILFSEKGLNAMLVGTLTPGVGGAAADIHPLAYYTLLGGWMHVFGESLVSVRMFSIIPGLGIVVLAYLLLRSIFADGRLASLGALGVAFAPFLVHYSQEVRMYALLALSLTGATYTFWQGLQSRQRRWWIWFSVCAASAQYTQNLAVFYLVPLALTPVFLRRWDKVKMTIFAGLGSVALYLPWLVQLPAQFAKVRNAYWVERPTIDRVFTTLLSFVTNLPVADRWLPLALIITLLVTALAVYQTYLAFRKKIPNWRRGLWLAWLAFAPPAMAFLISQWLPVYIERAFLASGIMFWLWLVWALTATRLPHFLQGVCLFLLTAGVALGLVTHLTYAGFPYGPYADLDASLRGRKQAGDLILHANKLSLLPAIYFDRTLEQHFLADLSGSETDTLAPATQAVIGVSEAPSLEDATHDATRVWFIIFQKALDEAVDLQMSRHPNLVWLDEHFHLDHMETWGPLLIYLYER